MRKRYEAKLRRQRRTMTKLRRENTSLRVRLGIAQMRRPVRYSPAIETR